jgi:hypothetical protein
MSVSKRNSLAGKSTGKSISAKYFAAHPEARKKKNAYNKRYHSTAERKHYRASLNKKNRSLGTYGNKDGKDASHTKKGKMVLEDSSKNRARNGHNGKSTKK